ncbi:hypothetical protein VNO80_22709 [Phaseolus coccineus]|uniref:Uncharacterized protein n=1 Tax=Phaseolus coccineus TaxID=3886 RepID=A0AAN9M8G3_PHACN
MWTEAHSQTFFIDMVLSLRRESPKGFSLALRRRRCLSTFVVRSENLLRAVPVLVRILELVSLTLRSRAVGTTVSPPLVAV